MSASPCFQACGERTDSEIYHKIEAPGIRVFVILRYKSNNKVIYNSKYYCVWCPKYRRKVPEGKIAKRCEQVIRKTAAKYRAEIVALEVLPDHVHWLVEIDPQFGIHRLVKNLKGVSSHVLRKEFKSLRTLLPSLWTNAYFVSTVGGAPIAVIRQYVENQKNV